MVVCDLVDTRDLELHYHVRTLLEKMFPSSTLSAFKPFNSKRIRAEPAASNDVENQDTSHENIAVSSNVPETAAMSRTPVILSPPDVDFKPRRIRRAMVVKVKRNDERISLSIGSGMAVTMQRKALLKASPLLNARPEATNFKCLVLSADVLKTNSVLTPKSLDCFASLCEAMYVENVPLQHFEALDVAGARVLARALNANGIMVLCNHLLKAQKTNQSSINRGAASSYTQRYDTHDI